MSFIQIAIDGPAGSGKSTVAKRIAEKLGILYLDTGAMYRALTYYMLLNGLDVKSSEDLKKAIDHIEIQMDSSAVFLNGLDVTDLIRSPEVSSNVSYVAMDSYVRSEMVKQQQNIAGNLSVVMDGRDIGTHVLPSATHKFFLVATSEERAKRRFIELREKGHNTTIEELIKEIDKRDELDSNRECSPLQKAQDALTLDTTQLTIDQVTECILNSVLSIEAKT